MEIDNDYFENLNTKKKTALRNADLIKEWLLIKITIYKETLCTIALKE